MNPLPYFHSHVRNTFTSDFKRIAREISNEETKKRQDEVKRKKLAAQNQLSTLASQQLDQIV
jgi:hypothetical protein